MCKDSIAYMGFYLTFSAENVIITSYDTEELKVSPASLA